MNDTLRIRPKRNTRIIHIETDLGIVNIYLGLHNTFGQRVESVEVIPDDGVECPDGAIAVRMVEKEN